MKRIIYLLLLVALSVACSGPKYTASFMNYSKNKSSAVVQNQSIQMPRQEVNPNELVASTSVTPVELAPASVTVTKTYKEMTRAERREVRTEIKKELKSFVKAKESMGKNSIGATQAMDKDLKLGLIFLLVGVVGYWIAWPVGAVLTIIGLVFLIKWLIRQ